jgi:type-F conjugative transfer system pilin assembly protein TrbC
VLRVLILAMVLSVLGTVVWASATEAMRMPDSAAIARESERARTAVREALDARRAQKRLPAAGTSRGSITLPATAPNGGVPLSLPSPRPWDVERDVSLLVLVSFSMPKPTLRALATDARRVGAPMVLRGLVNDSLPDTLSAVHDLVGEDAVAAGFAIDPTLFSRLGVSAVPTWVLLLEPLRTCTKDRCEVPRHLRVSGEAGVRHVLETMEREGDAAAASAASTLLARLETKR